MNCKYNNLKYCNTFGSGGLHDNAHEILQMKEQSRISVRWEHVYV